MIVCVSTERVDRTALLPWSVETDQFKVEKERTGVKWWQGRFIVLQDPGCGLYIGEGCVGGDYCSNRNGGLIVKCRAHTSVSIVGGGRWPI